MAITQAVANVFKQELLKGNHNFISAAQGGGTAAYYLALYTSSATLGATTTGAENVALGLSLIHI